MNEDKIFITRSLLPPYEEYIEAIKPLWESHWITNMGVHHKKLEMKLKEFLQTPEVSLIVNGHMALELTIQAMGFPRGAEVITTPFTFISTTHAILRNNLQPVFCDVKECDGTIDERKIEELITEKTVAIIPVHVYGHICNIEEIAKIAEKYHLKIIYDAAHSFGEKYKNINVANFGDASVFSFHATKVYNTIEGGAVTFKDHSLYEKLYNLKNFGIRGEEIVEEIGANAKMNEFAAIMGLCNLQHIEAEITKRKKKFDFYMEKLQGMKGIKIFKHQDSISYNYSYLPVIIDEKSYGISRDVLYEEMRKRNVWVRKYFYPLTADQKCFKGKYEKDSLDIARKLAKQVIVLPLYGDLEQEKIEKICQIIGENCRVFPFTYE